MKTITYRTILIDKWAKITVINLPIVNKIANYNDHSIDTVTIKGVHEEVY